MTAELIVAVCTVIAASGGTATACVKLLRELRGDPKRGERSIRETLTGLEQKIDKAAKHAQNAWRLSVVTHGRLTEQQEIKDAPRASNGHS